MKSLFISFLIIIFFEVILFFKLGNTTIEKNIHNYTLFTNNFKSEGTAPSKQVLKLKTEILGNLESDFLQIGDSSGFFGVQPNIIELYFGEKKYLNLSCCANTGWEGYAVYANYLLKNNYHTDYLIFYFTPYSLPMQYKEGYSKNMINYYGGVSFFDFKFINRIPSLYYRDNILDFVFKKDTNNSINNPKQFLKSINVTNFEKNTKSKANQFTDFLIKSKGWLPYGLINSNNIYQVPFGECDQIGHFYDNKKKPTLNINLQKIKDITDRYNKKLILLYNPVACYETDLIKPIINDLEKFKKNNPDVIVPFNFITTFDFDNFSDAQHLSPAGSIINSHRIGSRLKEMINNF